MIENTIKGFVQENLQDDSCNKVEALHNNKKLISEGYISLLLYQYHCISTNVQASGSYLFMPATRQIEVYNDGRVFACNNVSHLYQKLQNNQL